MRTGSFLVPVFIFMALSAPHLADIASATLSVPASARTSLNFLNSNVTATPPYGLAPLTVQFNVTARGHGQVAGGSNSYSYCWIVHGIIPSWQVSGEYSYTTQQNPVAILTSPGIHYFYQSTNNP